MLRALWVALAAWLILAVLFGIIRGTFYTGPAPAPAPAEKAPQAAPPAPGDKAAPGVTPAPPR